MTEIRNFFVAQANPEHLSEDDFIARIKKHLQLTEEDLREVGLGDDFRG